MRYERLFPAPSTAAVTSTAIRLRMPGLLKLEHRVNYLGAPKSGDPKAHKSNGQVMHPEPFLTVSSP